MFTNTRSVTRIYQIVFGVAFLFVCYGAVRSMMFGSVTKAKQIAFLSMAFGVIMLLDTKYWLLLPLCMILGIKVPGLPFNSIELGCIVFSSMHLMRMALRRDVTTHWNRCLLCAFPLFFWICFVWMLNPTGMHILRSSSMGGRFYFRILFAFVAMCCLGSIRLEEADCRLFFQIIVCGAILSIVLNGIAPGLRDIEEESQNLSRYYLLAFAGLYNILWARYSIMDILTSIRLLAIVALSGLSMIISGKRSVTASVALLPIYRALLTGRHIAITMLASFVVLLLLSVAVSMDGRFFDIPYSARRSLAMVFHKYRDRSHEGLHDTFREEVHAGAKLLIREHPWMGRKGFRMNRDTAVWLYGMGFEGRFAGHMFSGNWHGAFWAFAADFGIPCLVFYLFMVWRGLAFIFNQSRHLPSSSWRSACFLFYAMQFVHASVIMFTSGHSSLTAEQCMLQLGMLTAIANGMESDNTSDYQMLSNDSQEQILSGTLSTNN